MISIEVDNEVMTKLRDMISDFGDTPNSLIRRMMRLSEPLTGDNTPTSNPIKTEPVLDSIDEKPKTKSKAKSKSSKSRKNSVNRTPQIALRPEILAILEQMGGECSDLTKCQMALFERMRNRLTFEDMEHLSNGSPRYWNTAQWERNNMIEAGLLDKTAPHGTWRLTEFGKGEASKLRAPTSPTAPAAVQTALLACV